MYATLTETVPNLNFEEGLPDASKNVVVMDDLMAEADDRVTTLFTKKNHHVNTSVLHQSECAIHGAVQEPSRRVADNAPGQTDVSGSGEIRARVV